MPYPACERGVEVKFGATPHVRCTLLGKDAKAFLCLEENPPHTICPCYRCKHSPAFDGRARDYINMKEDSWARWMASGSKEGIRSRLREFISGLGVDKNKQEAKDIMARIMAKSVKHGSPSEAAEQVAKEEGIIDA